jgi:hypothetical protein
VKAEQRVTLDEVQLTAAGVRELQWGPREVGGGIQAQQVVQPALHRITWGVPDTSTGSSNGWQQS